jgi:hypothetical protein
LKAVQRLRHLDTFLAAVAGFVITYVFTHHSGIGVSPDSISYVSAARNVLHTGTLMDFTTRPLVDFPAGYPLILAALLALTHIDPFAFMPLMDPLLFALLIVLCGYLADKAAYPSPWTKTALLACIALSPALIEVYIMLWSETLFIVLIVLFLISLHRFMRLRTTSSLLVTAGVCALACTIRYAGVTLVATGGFLILLEKYPSFKDKFKHLLLFGTVSVSLLVINLARNYHISGTLTGKRQKGVTPLLRNIYYYGSTFTGWFFYGTDHYRLCLSLGLVFLTLLVLLFTPVLLKEYPSLVRIALAFSLVFSLFMVVSATVSRYEQMDSRLLSPLYIPLLVSLAYPLARFGRNASRSARRWWKAFAVVCLLLVLSSQLLADYQWNSDISDAGIGGYTEDIWKDSPLVQFLRAKQASFLPGYTLYSNSPEAVYFFTGRHCQLLPQKAFPGPIRQFFAQGHQYLIWFDDGDNPAILTQETVLAGKRLKLLGHFEDGAVYMTADADDQQGQADTQDKQVVFETFSFIRNEAPVHKEPVLPVNHNDGSDEIYQHSKRGHTGQETKNQEKGPKKLNEDHQQGNEIRQVDRPGQKAHGPCIPIPVEPSKQLLRAMRKNDNSQRQPDDACGPIIGVGTEQFVHIILRYIQVVNPSQSF